MLNVAYFLAVLVTIANIGLIALIIWYRKNKSNLRNGCHTEA
jgi:hypothetical protein